MRTILGCTVVLALAFAGGVQADDEKGGKIDAKKLVGKWKPAEAKGPEMVAEFQKDGKLLISGKAGETEIKITGTYKLEGDKLTLNMEFMGETMSETVTLTKLTDDEMVGVDKDGKEETFKRVKEEKKDKE